MEIAILEKLETANKQTLQENELKWIKIVNTAYPFGLNDSIKGYGNVSDWTNINPMKKVTNPYFNHPIAGLRKRTGKKRKRSKKLDDDFIDKIENLISMEKYREAYVELQHASNRTVKNAIRKMQISQEHSNSIRLIISGYAMGCFNRLTPTATKKRKPEGIRLVIPYVNKTIEKAYLEGFLNKTKLQSII